MAIDLLAGIKKNTSPSSMFPKPAQNALSTTFSQPSGGMSVMNSAQQRGTPIGVTAKSPTTKAAGPKTTLPSAQQNPVYTPPPVQPKMETPKPAPLATATAPAQQPVQPPAPPTFPGILGQLVSRANEGSTAAQGYTKQAAQYGADSIPVANQARDIAQQFGQKYADIGQQGAKFMAGQLTTGTSPVAEGNAAVTAQSTAAQQSALAQGEQAALQGIGYGLTGQQQAANAANAAASQEYTGYTQGLGALQNAANLAHPTPTAYGQTSFNPVTSSFGGGGSNLDPQSQAQSLAQQVMSGQISYDQAVSSLGYAGNVGTTFLNSAITGAGGNPLQLQAQGAGQQGVIGQQTAQVEGYKSALQQGQNLQAQLTDLITSFGLNPNDVNGVNVGLQKIAKNISSPQYKILSNYVNDIANTYSQVLTPPGGSATDTTRGIAASMLDATAKGESIIQTMHSLDEAAKAKIAGVPTIGGGSTGNSSSAVNRGGVPNPWH